MEFCEDHLNFPVQVIQAHLGSFLYITSFDSGRLSPTRSEKRIGWVRQGEVMVSPKLSAQIDIPYDRSFDEWYFFNEKVEFPADHEVFVNYAGGSLMPIEDQVESFSARCTRDGLDWLVQRQQRFWSQIEACLPTTYVAMGMLDTIVSTDLKLIQLLRDNA
ncbi:MAG: hypothetical protein GXP29_09795 [Planctomycetes bacterium]|nr:hypothetical protein [Planctomycetota bacterium]